MTELTLVDGTVTGHGLSRLLPSLPLNRLSLRLPGIGREEMAAILRDSRASELVFDTCQFADESWESLPQSAVLKTIQFAATAPSEAQCRQLTASTQLYSLQIYGLEHLSPQLLERMVAGSPLSEVSLNVSTLRAEKTLLGLRGCPNLRSVAIPGAAFDATAADAFEKLPMMEVLVIGYNSPVDPQELFHLGRLSRLTNIQLAEQKRETVSATLPILTQLPALEHLALSDFEGSDDDFQYLSQLQSLKTINVARPAVDPEFEARFAKWQSEHVWLNVFLNGKLTFHGVDFAAERRAAEWLAKNIKGGDFMLFGEDGSQVKLSDTHRDVPQGNFVVRVVEADCGEADDLQIDALGGCRGLTVRSLSSKVTAKGLHWLGQNRGLTSLALSPQQILAPEFFAQLEPLSRLERLHIPGATGDLASFRQLPRLPKLQQLTISGIPFKDEHFPDLKAQCPNLRDIIMQHQGSQPESVRPLEGHPTIEAIHCDSSHLTPEGLAVLKTLPKLTELVIQSPVVDPPEALRRVAELSDRLTHLSLLTWYDWDTGPTDADYDVLLAMPKLEEIVLGNHSGSPSDKHLDLMAKLPGLRSLTVAFNANKRRYTPEGIERFRKSRPEVRLVIDGTEYPTTAP